MPSNLNGAGRNGGGMSGQEQQAQQSRDRMQDANSSAHPNQISMTDLRRMRRK